MPVSFISLAAIVALTVGEAGTQSAPVFQAASSMVLVPVTVTDRNARTVEGLRAQDFTVFDNQVSQPIASFGMEDAPCSIGIVLDVSGSMKQTLPAAKALMHAFFGASNPADEYLLMTVSTQPSAVSAFTADIASLEENIGPAQSGGLTSLNDTIYDVLKQMKRGQNTRRALLVLSDGMDNHSRHSESELMSVALEADVQVYTMIFDNGMPGSNTVPFRPGLAAKPWDIARERQGPDYLEKIATKTGGLFFHVRSGDEATEAVVKTGNALRSEYLIGFHPVDAGASGTWHKIRVKASVPKVSVHARNGYYAR